MDGNNLPNNLSWQKTSNQLPNNKSATEIKSLTGLRGIAALYVVIYHWYRFNSTLLYQLPVGFQTFIKHGYLSVDMFFILSGFVIALSSKKLFKFGINRANYILFMKRRFARIYPVYLVITIIAFIVLFHLGHIKSLVLNLILVQTLTSAQYILGPSWSLSAEWFAYLVFPIFFYFAYYRDKLYWNLICFIFSFCILLIISFNFNHLLNGIQSVTETYGPLDKYRGLAAILRCFAEYLIGISLFKLCSNYQARLSKHLQYVALVSSFLILVSLLITRSDVFIVFLLTMLIGSLYVDRGIIANLLSSKFCYFLGLISYSLYLIHPIIIELQNQIYQQLFGHIMYADKISYLIGFALLIGLSYITHTFIEVPSRNYAKTLLKIY